MTINDDITYNYTITHHSNSTKQIKNTTSTILTVCTYTLPNIMHNKSIINNSYKHQNVN